MDELGVLTAKTHAYVMPENGIEAGGMFIRSFRTPHDSRESTGYSIVTCDNKRISVSTDIGCMTDTVMNAIYGSDLVLLESNHDVEMLKAGKYTYQLKRRILSGIGHLSNDDAGDAALRLVAEGTKGIILGHLSINNNVETLAFRTVANRLEAGGVAVGKQVGLMMAKRDCATGMFDAL